MEIRGVGPSKAPQEYQRPADPRSASARPTTQAEDTVQISEEARRLLQNEVKHWLSVGRRVEDLANSLADRLLQAGLAKSPEEARSLSEKVAGALAEPTGKSSRPNLAEIQERVRSGYYSSPGIVERIAEKILGELGL